MNSKMLIGLAIVVLLAGGAYFFVSNQSDTNTTTESSTSTSTPVSESSNNTEPVAEDAANTQEYSAEEVALHSSPTDCWTIIEGNVYDISSYVGRHPGGSEILRACGTDGTTLFTTRTTEDGEKVGSGTPHSSNAGAQLEQYLIGQLAN